jgi:hypothetical protein
MNVRLKLSAYNYEVRRHVIHWECHMRIVHPAIDLVNCPRVKRQCAKWDALKIA